MADERTITAYQINRDPGVRIVPAPRTRAWMDATFESFAYRCLPLNLANQNGWWLTSPATFDAIWNGNDGTLGVSLRFYDQPHPGVQSHFGNGVITFSVPYLFRTPPGINLWVKGPTNQPKDGIFPLEGLVETDWAVSTFTMNWKMTCVNEWIRFETGEPICQVVPVPRGLIDSFIPKLTMMDNHPDVKAAYDHWATSRRTFERDWKAGDPDARKQSWQKDYVQGKTTQGERFEAHQMRLDVKPFPIVPDENG